MNREIQIAASAGAGKTTVLYKLATFDIMAGGNVVILNGEFECLNTAIDKAMEQQEALRETFDLKLGNTLNLDFTALQESNRDHLVAAVDEFRTKSEGNYVVYADDFIMMVAKDIPCLKEMIAGADQVVRTTQLHRSAGE